MNKKRLFSLFVVLILISLTSLNVLASCDTNPTAPECQNNPAPSGGWGIWSKLNDMTTGWIMSMNSGILTGYNLELKSLEWLKDVAKSKLPIYIFIKIMKIIFYLLFLTACYAAFKTAWSVNDEDFFYNMKGIWEPFKSMFRAVIGLVVVQIKFMLVFVLIIFITGGIIGYASLEGQTYANPGSALLDTIILLILVIVGILILVASLIAIVAALLYIPLGVVAFMLKGMDKWDTIASMLNFVLNFFLIVPALFLLPSYILTFLNVEAIFLRHLLLIAGLICGVVFVYVINLIFPALLEMSIATGLERRIEKKLETMSKAMMSSQKTALTQTATGAVPTMIIGRSNVNAIKNMGAGVSGAASEQQQIIQTLARENQMKSISSEFKKDPLLAVQKSASTFRDYRNSEIRNSAATENSVIHELAKSRVENKAAQIKIFKQEGKAERKILRSLGAKN